MTTNPDLSRNSPRDWLDIASKEMKGGDPQDLVWDNPPVCGLFYS